MTINHKYQDTLTDFDRSVAKVAAEEINKHKWIESEKAGKDIGWDRACREWLQKHFPRWERARWQHVIAATLQSDASLN